MISARKIEFINSEATRGDKKQDNSKLIRTHTLSDAFSASLFPRCEVTHYKTKSDTQTRTVVALRERESTRLTLNVCALYNEIFQYNWVGVLCTYESELQNELYGMSGRCRKLSLRHGTALSRLSASVYMLSLVICIIHYFAVRQTRLLSWHWSAYSHTARHTLTLAHVITSAELRGERAKFDANGRHLPWLCKSRSGSD
jgi:hypothetical protein